MKLYDTVLELLINHPELRDSDKKLIWRVWEIEAGKRLALISLEYYMGLTTPESITRCRRKIQELRPALQGSEFVTNARREKAEEKGTFIFRERLKKKEIICVKCGGSGKKVLLERPGKDVNSVVLVPEVVCQNCGQTEPYEGS